MSTQTAPALARDHVRTIDSLVHEYCTQTRTPGVSLAIHYPELFGDAGFLRPYGLARLQPVIEVTPGTVFGLGSVTKVFTSLLVACSVEQGHAQLSDPVIHYLSRQYGAAGSKNFDGIRLVDLATHTSGMPDNAPRVPHPGDELFTDAAPSEAMLRYWSQFQGKVPSCWQYSNTAFVTLGFAVSGLFPGTEGNQYDSLLRDYVTAPLEMNQTSSSAPESSFAKGYVRKGEDLERTPAKIVAADLKSSGSDMLRLLKAYLQQPRSESLLDKAIALTARSAGCFPVCCEAGKTMEMGLAWQITSPGYTVYTKDGSTAEGGFGCIVEFVPERQFGVAVLTNQVWLGHPSGSVHGPSSLAKSLREALLN